MAFQSANPELISSMFGEIAERYDLANDLITFGLARIWRKKLVSLSGAPVASRILDCATGTGDLAFEFKKRVGPLGQVVGVDFVDGMLERARTKSKKKNLPVEFQWADVTKLPFKDREFAVTSIAYGLRNVENPLKAVQEMTRVTVPGGRVMILETGEPKGLIRWYFQKMVPLLGGLVSGRRSAYEYLQKSSGEFPAREALVQWLTKTGLFSSVECTPLLGGASFVYKAVVGQVKSSHC